MTYKQCSVLLGMFSLVSLGVVQMNAVEPQPDAVKTQTVAAATQPNVLFLAVDDMNDWIGCLETTPHALTPNIYRLAARGVNLTNGHTAGVFCTPSRAAIFSG